MAELRIRVPGPTEPGYVRRLRKLARLQELREDRPLEAIDGVISFLMEFVDADEGVDAEAALEELSQEEFDALVSEFASSGAGIPPTSGGS